MKDAARARRPLVLAPRKKDLNPGHLELLAVDARLRVRRLAVRVAVHVQGQPRRVVLQANGMRHERPVVHDGGEGTIRMLKK